MATFVKTDSIAVANKRVKHGVLTLGTYATGGESILPSVFGLKKITSLSLAGVFTKTSDSSDALAARYIHTTNLMVVYRQKDPGNAGGADIALPQVANGVDLSGYAAHVVVWGY